MLMRGQTTTNPPSPALKAIKLDSQRLPPPRRAFSRTSAFRFAVGGSTVSMLGTKISTLAFPLLVLWLGGSPVLAGVAVCATVMPGMLLYFPAGVIVDRVNPWRVMTCCESARGMVMVSMAVEILINGRHSNIPFLLSAVLAEETLEIFTTLAERRYLNWLMPPEENDRRRAQQAAIEARTHIAVLAGRPIAPFLFIVGPFLPFFTDATSFVFSVTGLLLSRGSIRRQTSPVPPAKKTIESGSIGEAFGRMSRDRHIWLVSLLMAMMSLVAQALILIFLTEAHSHRFSAATIGLILAASGLGGAVGSYCSKSILGLPFVRQNWFSIQMAAWFATCAALLLAGGSSAWWSGCTMFVFSVTGAVGNVKFSTYLNVRVEDNLLGKVSGIYYATSIGACAIGPVIGGYLTEQRGIHYAVSSLFILVVLMNALSLPLRKSSGQHPERDHPPVESPAQRQYSRLLSISYRYRVTRKNKNPAPILSLPLISELSSPSRGTPEDSGGTGTRHPIGLE